MKLCDVALNIFAKPYQTSLAVLSLLKMCRPHIGTLWLQFEPAGSRFDSISPYTIAFYLQESKIVPYVIFQPEIWFDCDVAQREHFTDTNYRLGIRYEYAMENAKSRYLYLMHNDVFIQKDIVGAMLERIGDAFAIGPLGQCWNCPASRNELTQSVLHRNACSPDTYTDFPISYEELCALYREADRLKLFRRSYSSGLAQHFSDRPWPLPECRINEWACLIDLEKTRPLTIPFGDTLPFGAYEQCGTETLDIGVSWFRSMHAHGFRARNFSSNGWMTHFVGTYKKTQLRYTQAEEYAKKLLERHFPDFCRWCERSQKKVQTSARADTDG